MANIISEIKNDMIKEDEEIIDRIINERGTVLNAASNYVFLTDERLIFSNPSFLDKLMWTTNIVDIDLDDIEDVMYQPKPIHSGGMLAIINDKGKKVVITQSYVGESLAKDFVNSLRKYIEG